MPVSSVDARTSIGTHAPLLFSFTAGFGERCEPVRSSTEKAGGTHG